MIYRGRDFFRDGIEAVFDQLGIQALDVVVFGSCLNFSDNRSRWNAVEKADSSIPVDDNRGYGLGVNCFWMTKSFRMFLGDYGAGGYTGAGRDGEKCFYYRAHCVEEGWVLVGSWLSDSWSVWPV